jgi:hypothetical protein
MANIMMRPGMAGSIMPAKQNTTTQGLRKIQGDTKTEDPNLKITLRPSVSM